MFCNKIGNKKESAVMKCPSCKTKNLDGMKFCKMCGCPLNNEALEGNGDGFESFIYDDDYPRESNKVLAFLIVSIIMVLIAIGVCVFMLFKDNFGF